MNPETRQQLEIDASLAAFTRQAANFGAFPLPTENTILAAELLGRSLLEADAVDAGAISVVEMKAAGRTTFLMTASGGGSISRHVVDAMRLRLKDELQSNLVLVDCHAVDTAALFYSPAHNDTAQFITRSFPAFALPGHPLDATDLQTAIQNMNALPESEFGKKPDGNQLNNLTPTVTAVKQLLAIAVAIRISAFDRAQVVAARVTLDNYFDRLRDFAYPDREELADNLDALAMRGGNPHSFPYREDPQQPISTVNAIQAPVAEAWRVADLSRYCAEPKSFNYILIHGMTDPVVGQLAMWWDRNRPNRYSFDGSDSGPYGNYMLPCTSCRARSAAMMAGVPVQQLTTAEEPVRTVPQTRTRSSSFS